MSEKIRVFVVDDHAIVRMGVAALVDSQPDMKLVGEAEDGGDAVRMAARLRPDVILMDIMMPGMDGISAIRKIRDDCARGAEPGGGDGRKPGILVLTTSTVSDDLAAALDAGASGVVIKSEANSKLLAAIRAVASDGQVCSTEAQAAIRRDPPAQSLSPRQREILAAVARGLSNPEIAAMFGCSVESIKDRISICCQKLGAANRTEAVATAYRKHLLK